MIERLEISGLNNKEWPNLKKYIFKKIGKLDRYLPKNVKKSVHAKVFLSQNKSKTKDKTKFFICEVVLELPQQTITAKEETDNFFSSVDIVEAKLTRQIRKYKTAHSAKRKYRVLCNFLGRFKGKK